MKKRRLSYSWLRLISAPCRPCTLLRVCIHAKKHLDNCPLGRKRVSTGRGRASEFKYLSLWIHKCCQVSLLLVPPQVWRCPGAEKRHKGWERGPGEPARLQPGSRSEEEEPETKSLNRGQMRGVNPGWLQTSRAPFSSESGWRKVSSFTNVLISTETLGGGGDRGR